MADAHPPYRFSDERIHVTNLRVNCIIGVNPHERVEEQPLIINVSFPVDFGAATPGDDLSWTVNYSEVAQEIRAFSREGRFHLLETLARRLAVRLCERFDLTQVTLHIRKPSAIADSDGSAVSLSLQRSKP